MKSRTLVSLASSGLQRREFCVTRICDQLDLTCMTLLCTLTLSTEEVARSSPPPGASSTPEHPKPLGHQGLPIFDLPWLGQATIRLETLLLDSHQRRQRIPPPPTRNCPNDHEEASQDC